MRILTRPTAKPAKGVRFMGLNGYSENYILIGNGGEELR